MQQINNFQSLIDDKTREDFLSILGGTPATQNSEQASVIIDQMKDRPKEQRVELMEMLIREFGRPRIKNKRVLPGLKMDEDEFRQISGVIAEVVSGSMKFIVQTRMSPSEAAEYLTDLVFRFGDRKQQVVCLVLIMADNAVPYVPVPPSNVTDFPQGQLDAMFKEDKDDVYQIMCIRRGGFGPTKEADLLLKALNSIDDEERRVGLMAFILSSATQQAS